MSENLERMTDAELAAFQAGWKPRTRDDILAEREWQRRMIAHEFNLNRKIAEINSRWAVIAAFIGVAGTLGGAWLGAALQFSATGAAAITNPASHAEPAGVTAATGSAKAVTSTGSGVSK